MWNLNKLSSVRPRENPKSLRMRATIRTRLLRRTTPVASDDDGEQRQRAEDEKIEVPAQPELGGIGRGAAVNPVPELVQQNRLRRSSRSTAAGSFRVRGCVVLD